MPDYLGRQLGNYRLTSLLGQGGFADVYLGEHVYLKTQAAIKVLRTVVSKTDSEGFLGEARAIANLVHPNIVRVLEFGVEGNIPFLVMDYAPNSTLRERHPKGTHLPLETILPYVKQVAAALQYAHNQKVIHRDVKPENMLIGRNNEILLSDFGIAVVAQSSNYRTVQEVGGTVAYMAPEQLQGQASVVSDQYALGIIVYEWLCGECPFRGSFFEVASQHALAPVPPLSQKIPSISPTVEGVVLRALTKDPQQRFRDVQTFANALEQASQSSRVPITFSPPVELSQPGVVNTPPNQSLPPLKQATPLFAQAALPGESVPPKQGMSRRAVVVGLGGLIGVVAAGGGIAWLFQRIGKPTLGTAIFIYTGHSASVFALAWSPDGIRIVSGSEDKTVQVWDATSGSHNLIYHGHTSRVWAAAWSQDGMYIASGGGEDVLFTPGENIVQVWDATSGNTIFTYRGHSNVVKSVTWSPDSKRIASGAWDDTVQVWDAANGSQVLTYRSHGRPVQTVAWSPNGKHIASGGDDNKVRIWDSSTGDDVFIYQGHSDYVQTVAWSPDGMYIASGSHDGSIQVWSANNGKPIFTHNDQNSQVNAVSWSPDGRHIAYGSSDATVYVWDVTSGSLTFTCKGHTNRVWTVAWSPDGTHIASGSEDRTVRVWQAS